MYAEIAKLTPAKTTDEWLKLCAQAEIPAMEARDMSTVFEEPHLKATGFFRSREHPTEGTFREMAPPIRFSADTNRTLGLAPKLGEHSAEIKASLGK